MAPEQHKDAGAALAAHVFKDASADRGGLSCRLEAERQSWDEGLNARAARLLDDEKYFASQGHPGVTARMMIDHADSLVKR